MSKFKIGDIVEAHGVTGKVVSLISEDTEYLEVEFPELSYRVTFFLDGRALAWHKEPSLKLVERPKAKVKKVLYPIVTAKYGQPKLSEVLYESIQEFLEKSGWELEDVIGLGPAVEIEVLSDED